MNFFKTKYRVVTDNYLGYEAQYRPWFLPFWQQLNRTNTRSTIEEALELCKTFKHPKKPTQKTVAVLED